MPKKSESSKEAIPDSPLRRSTRISLSTIKPQSPPIKETHGPAKRLTRSSSTSSEPPAEITTSAKVTKGRRLSLTEDSLHSKNTTAKPASLRNTVLRRSVSKSPETLQKEKESNGIAAPRITRRSLRGRSISPTSSIDSTVAETVTTTGRKHKPSISEKIKPLDTIEEFTTGERKATPRKRTLRSNSASPESQLTSKKLLDNVITEVIDEEDETMPEVAVDLIPSTVAEFKEKFAETTNITKSQEIKPDKINTSLSSKTEGNKIDFLCSVPVGSALNEASNIAAVSSPLLQISPEGNKENFTRNELTPKVSDKCIFDSLVLEVAPDVKTPLIPKVCVERLSVTNVKYSPKVSNIKNDELINFSPDNEISNSTASALIQENSDSDIDENTKEIYNAMLQSAEKDDQNSLTRKSLPIKKSSDANNVEPASIISHRNEESSHIKIVNEQQPHKSPRKSSSREEATEIVEKDNDQKSIEEKITEKKKSPLKSTQKLADLKTTPSECIKIQNDVSEEVIERKTEDSIKRKSEEDKISPRKSSEKCLADTDTESYSTESMEIAESLASAQEIKSPRKSLSKKVENLATYSHLKIVNEQQPRKSPRKSSSREEATEIVEKDNDQKSIEENITEKKKSPLKSTQKLADLKTTPSECIKIQNDVSEVIERKTEDSIKRKSEEDKIIPRKSSEKCLTDADTESYSTESMEIAAGLTSAQEIKSPRKSLSKKVENLTTSKEMSSNMNMNVSNHSSPIKGTDSKSPRKSSSREEATEIVEKDNDQKSIEEKITEKKKSPLKSTQKLADLKTTPSECIKIQNDVSEVIERKTEDSIKRKSEEDKISPRKSSEKCLTDADMESYATESMEIAAGLTSAQEIKSPRKSLSKKVENLATSKEMSSNMNMNVSNHSSPIKGTDSEDLTSFDLQLPDSDESQPEDDELLITNNDSKKEISPKKAKIQVSSFVDEKLNILVKSHQKQQKSSSDSVKSCSPSYPPDEEDENSEEDVANSFVDDLAEEVSDEDSNVSTDSNEIIEKGESIGSSTDDSNVSIDGSYENDSFIVDDDQDEELLEGEEYDLGTEELPKKKTKSRIISIEDSSDEDLDKMSTEPYMGFSPPSVLEQCNEESEASVEFVNIDEEDNPDTSISERNTQDANIAGNNKNSEVNDSTGITDIMAPKSSPIIKNIKSPGKRLTLVLEEEVNLSTMNKEDIQNLSQNLLTPVADMVSKSIEKTNSSGKCKMSLKMSLEYRDAPENKTDENEPIAEQVIKKKRRRSTIDTATSKKRKFSEGNEQIMLAEEDNSNSWSTLSDSDEVINIGEIFKQNLTSETNKTEDYIGGKLKPQDNEKVEDITKKGIKRKSSFKGVSKLEKPQELATTECVTSSQKKPDANIEKTAKRTKIVNENLSVEAPDTSEEETSVIVNTSAKGKKKRKSIKTTQTKVEDNKEDKVEQNELFIEESARLSGKSRKKRQRASKNVLVSPKSENDDFVMSVNEHTIPKIIFDKEPSSSGGKNKAKEKIEYLSKELLNELEKPGTLPANKVKKSKKKKSSDAAKRITIVPSSSNTDFWKCEPFEETFVPKIKKLPSIKKNKYEFKASSSGSTLVNNIVNVKNELIGSGVQRTSSKVLLKNKNKSDF